MSEKEKRVLVLGVVEGRKTKSLGLYKYRYRVKIYKRDKLERNFVGIGVSDFHDCCVCVHCALCNVYRYISCCLLHFYKIKVYETFYTKPFIQQGENQVEEYFSRFKNGPDFLKKFI